MNAKLARGIVRNGSAYSAARSLVDFLCAAIGVPSALIAAIASLDALEKMSGGQLTILGVAVPFLWICAFCIALIVRCVCMAIFDMADATLSRPDAFSEVRDHGEPVSMDRSLRHR